MPGFYVLGDKERIILKVRLSISIQLLKHNKCASISSIELTKILIFDRDGFAGCNGIFEGTGKAKYFTKR